MIDDGFIRLRFSFLAASNFLRCGSAKSVAEGKIPRFKVLSWIHQDRYGQGHAINEPSGLESGNCSIASLKTQMVRLRWIPVQIGLHEVAALRPWMPVPESLVALAAEVRLTYIGVSKTNDHLREFTVYKRPNQYKRKLSEWDILIIYSFIDYGTLYYWRHYSYLHLQQKSLIQNRHTQGGIISEQQNLFWNILGKCRNRMIYGQNSWLKSMVFVTCLQGSLA
ncbi:Hypothetical_protein [Hexamita inflata]|uniref:Hypothetical_protein n=1 Tax=Hexamita inflata TaxID=28002 RepID=A0AA86Q8R3_9EUKA|nr:Hypothetical protein HINF_LOCUS40316 [Hexamita inflata]